MKIFSEYFNTGSIKQQNMKRLGGLLICITALLLVLTLLILSVSSIAIAIKNRKAQNPDDTGEAPGSNIPAGYTTTTFDATQLASGALLLVDESHPYTGTPTVVEFKLSEDRAKTESGSVIYSVGGDGKAAIADAVKAFNAMAAAFYKESNDTNLYISSAYDTTATSQKIGYEAGTMLELDYYVDFDADPMDIKSIYQIEKYKWIYDNAKNYGFVQASTAEGEENIFRYVGIAHATYMTNNNKTLAEYLTYLRENKNAANKALTISAKDLEGNSVSYRVYYMAATETPVVPIKYTYEVSGDNMGGYIITVNNSAKVSN